MNDVLLTPLLAPDSPLDEPARQLVRALHERERQWVAGLPTDDPLDPKRRRRVSLTRPEIFAQPAAIGATLAEERGAVEAAAAELAVRPPKRIYVVGCGDSLAVAVGARSLLVEVLRMPCGATQALDFA